MTEPVQQTIADLAALKALSHPRRRSIMRQLSERGPATSAMLARDLELNTGATSYHLRELAARGFVTEKPNQGGGRQRWWQAVRRDFRFPKRSEQSGEVRLVVDELNESVLAADLAEFRQQMTNSDQLGEWEDVLPYSRSSIQVTPDELEELFEEYIALLNRYRRPGDDEAPEGAETIQIRMLAYPTPRPDPAPDE